MLKIGMKPTGGEKGDIARFKLQAARLFGCSMAFVRGANVNPPPRIVASTPEEAEKIAQALAEATAQQAPPDATAPDATPPHHTQTQPVPPAETPPQPARYPWHDAHPRVQINYNLKLPEPLHARLKYASEVLRHGSQAEIMRAAIEQEVARLLREAGIEK